MGEWVGSLFHNPYEEMTFFCHRLIAILNSATATGDYITVGVYVRLGECGDISTLSNPFGSVISI
jgi:hypothetical protein